jgi:hypothetical protein
MNSRVEMTDGYERSPYAPKFPRNRQGSITEGERRPPWKPDELDMPRVMDPRLLTQRSPVFGRLAALGGLTITALASAAVALVVTGLLPFDWNRTFSQGFRTMHQNRRNSQPHLSALPRPRRLIPELLANIAYRLPQLIQLPSATRAFAESRVMKSGLEFQRR